MMPAEFDVTGKVVFITGAGRGIGKGIAQVLAEAGADVALNALTPKYVEGTAAEIAAASGRRVVPVIADVTKGTGRFNLAQGVFGTVTGVGASLSPTLSGLIVHHFGYSAGFASLAGEGLVALLAVAIFLPETKEELPTLA